MISVAEYVAWRQPELVVIILGARVDAIREVEKHPFGWWKQLMQERPLPGRAGGAA